VEITLSAREVLEIRFIKASMNECFMEDNPTISQ
jgi:hypothetical protein